MSYTIKQIEDAILNALRNSQSLKNMNVRKIETYSGDPEDLVKQVTLYPTIKVVFSEEYWDIETQSTFNRNIKFTLLIGARSLRGTEEVKRKEGGIYDILEEVYSILAGKDLGLNITAIEILLGRAMYAEKGFFLYGVDIKTSFKKEVN